MRALLVTDWESATGPMRFGASLSRSDLARAVFRQNAGKEFEQRVEQLRSSRGKNTTGIARQISTFRVADFQAECPGVGLALIRQLLARLP
jgi:hypothetical protein